VIEPEIIITKQDASLTNGNVEASKNPEIEKTESSSLLKKEGIITEASSKQELPKPNTSAIKVSAFSLSSIKAKKELAETQKTIVKDTVHLPSEPFTATEMLEQWYKYAQRLNDKGHMIMESLLLINDPVLDDTKIIHELPNEGSKIDFEKEKPELLGYLRGRLHNHDISIEVKVNESIDSKKAFTAQDKFNRLNELNPNLELLRKMFDLDV
jgi:hypothetical protein